MISLAHVGTYINFYLVYTLTSVAQMQDLNQSYERQWNSMMDPKKLSTIRHFIH